MSNPPAADPDRFILDNTILGPTALVPEIRLHLADAVLALWEMTEVELQEKGVPPPYWAFAWPGGQAIARLLFDRPELVRGRHVLDLGAGGGIGAIAAAMAGAASVRANDIDRFALAAIQLNAAANGVIVESLGGDLLDRPAPACDIILAGDLCYERPMASRVLAWMRAASATGKLVILGDPGRSYAPADGLETIAEYTVPVSLDLEDREQRETTVWKVLPA